MKFSAIFDFKNKSHIKAGDGLTSGSYPFFTSSPVLSKFLDSYQFTDESLIFGTGGSASIHRHPGSFSVSTDCLVASLKDNQQNIFNTKFVYYYLSGNMSLLEEGFRGAGLKHISKGYINEIDIPAIPYDEQLKIVRILDQTDSIRKKRLHAINLLDEYLTSRYAGMFRDNKVLDTIKLETLSANHKGSMRTGPFGSDLKHSEFVDKGIAVIGIDNAVKNTFQWDKRRFITHEKYEKLKRYTLYPRDVIITIMGTTGRVAVIPDNIPLAINTKHLVAITFDKNKANPYLMCYALQTDPDLRRQMAKQSKGAIMDGLNLGIIKNLEVPKWPIELQNDFETIYLEVDKLKHTMFSQAKELDKQYHSIMQDAFSK